MKVRLAGLLFPVLLALVPGPVRPEAPPGADWVRSHYTKYEHRIAMRDGVRLFTAVYVPKDTASGPYPILLTRTPYGVAPYGSDHYKDALGPSDPLAREGYIFAYQDVRGRLMSEGQFVDVRPVKPVKSGPQDVDETTDAWDTVDWLVKHVRGNNGRVGIWGISYPGFYAAMGAIDAHPALKAVSPQAPISDWFVGDDFRHNGAVFLPHAFNFYTSFGRPRPAPSTAVPPRFDHGTADGYRFFQKMGPLANADKLYMKGDVAFWKEFVEHDTYDEFWKARNIRPHLKGIRPAIMTVGGWFDAEDLFGALEVYKSIERSSPQAVNTLVMGPWVHGGWARTTGEALGDVRFGAPTSAFFQEKVELPFFNYHLKGKGDGKLPEAWVFETGRNQWRALDSWPPRAATPKTLYLSAGGRLALEPPADESGYDEYVSDPARPVPFVNDVTNGMAKEYMVADQRFVATRPDVLVYESEPLEEDLTIAGPIAATLHVSTTGTDSDWIVKLIDVYPDDFPDPQPTPVPKPGDAKFYSKLGGYEQLVRGEPFRGKFRNGFDKPEAFVPGQTTAVEFTMPDAFHTFRRGHRLMVQVHSTWFPLVDLNPQVFMRIADAKPSDFRKATERVYRQKGAASQVRVGVLP
jgi:putative CocE/NonD family hydrolase